MIKFDNSKKISEGTFPKQGKDSGLNCCICGDNITTDNIYIMQRYSTNTTNSTASTPIKTLVTCDAFKCYAEAKN